MNADVAVPHVCNERCRCPLCDGPIYFAPEVGRDACFDPACAWLESVQPWADRVPRRVGEQVKAGARAMRDASLRAQTSG